MAGDHGHGHSVCRRAGPPGRGLHGDRGGLHGRGRARGFSSVVGAKHRKARRWLERRQPLLLSEVLGKKRPKPMNPPCVDSADEREVPGYANGGGGKKRGGRNNLRSAERTTRA